MSLPNRFIHLRVHSAYSMAEGAIKVGKLAALCAANSMPAVALTDTRNLFGALEFSVECSKAGVQPVIGCQLSVRREDVTTNPMARAPEPDDLVVLVQNAEGYGNLLKLVSKAFLETTSGETPQVSWADVAAHGAGLIALTSGPSGTIGRHLLDGQRIKAEEALSKLAAIFPGRLYVEISRHGLRNEERIETPLIEMAYAYDIPLVATNECFFADEGMYNAHDALICIAAKSFVSVNGRRRLTPHHRFKTAEEMVKLFADLPEAITNTIVIAQRCAFKVEERKPILPRSPKTGSRTEEEALRDLARAGLDRRLEKIYAANASEETRAHVAKPYRERLEYELDTIVKMGFAGYFMIVADFIQWSKEHGIPVGPGRGSGAGSLVAWALKITDLDPLQYNLLFERFLNPERVSMPDFDIDFCQSNRDRVIDYVKEKYGKDAVSQIATFGTMAAKAAIRDVGRVMDMSYTFCDGISKLVPGKPGMSYTLAYPPEQKKEGDKNNYALELEPMLYERVRKEEDVKTIIEMAQKLEGMTRNIGMHAGGVLIAPGKLTDFCPLYQQPGSESAVSQYDKDDVEAIGLVKFDFLGLATLTILEIAREFIMKRHKGQENFAFENIPLDDGPTYRLFSEGKTEAVFQFESRGMQGMLKEARPSRLEDLIALNALYRPGPMDLIPSFVNRKHGKEEVIYPHPLVEPVLSETYGIMVYQEQVMQTAQVLGGYSLGGADMLRRAMGKKKAEEMAEHRAIFRKGAAEKGISQEKADEVFDLMEKFAGYGFNKSHAAAYSLLAYHTGWLKVHYTAEFYCANMTVEMDDTDKLKVLYEDAVKHFGMTFEPPDINRGNYRFEPVTDKVIRYGLGAIKGTGQQAIEAMVAAREGRGEGPQGSTKGPFKSLFDFCVRVDKARMNKRTVEALIKAGAFDAIHLNRAALVASIDRAFDFAAATLANVNQGGLFDMMGEDAHGSSTQEPDLVDVLPWGIKERLTQEKTAIGFYLSGHLFDEVATEVRRFVRTSIDELLDSREPQVLAGIVSDFRVINGQRGKLGLFRLDDKSGVIEASADEALLNTYRNQLKEDEFIVVMGRLQMDHFSGGLRVKVQQVWDLAGARCRFGKYLHVAVQDKGPDVQRLVKEFPPRREEVAEGELVHGLRVRMGVRCTADDAAAVAELQLGESARFYPSDAALAAWTAQAGSGSATVVYE